MTGPNLRHLAASPKGNAIHSQRFPTSEAHLPVGIDVSGATLSVLSTNPDWRRSVPEELVSRPLSQRRLPPADVIREQLLAPSSSMRALRSFSQYACHDLRVISRGEHGELRYLATRRLEPNAGSNFAPELVGAKEFQHSAPLNGFWWPPGGRVLCPTPNSKLQADGFDVVDSALIKLHSELGITPAQVRGVYLLGVGQTSLPPCMTYTYRGNDGQNTYSFETPVRMELPQNTININYVIEVPPDTKLTPSTLTSLAWINADDYLRHRGQFCEYEQHFLDTLFNLKKIRS